MWTTAVRSPTCSCCGSGTPTRVLLEQAGLKIGTEARLLARAGGDTAPKPLLEGVVTALEVELDDSGTFTVVRGLDESHRLFRGRRVASYQNMTLADICGQVAQRAGLRPGPVDIAGPVLEHIAQPNVTDWEFVRGLAEEAGAQAYVRDGRLHITKPADAGSAPDASARAERDPLYWSWAATCCAAGPGCRPPSRSRRWRCAVGTSGRSSRWWAAPRRGPLRRWSWG
ncbi:hypothetical protein SCALM49S_00572 [Streptomyces californicus]